MLEGSPGYAASSNMGLAQKTSEGTNPNPKSVKEKPNGREHVAEINEISENEVEESRSNGQMTETEDSSENEEEWCRNNEQEVERKEKSVIEMENIRDSELVEELKESKEVLTREAHGKKEEGAQIWRKGRPKRPIKMRKTKISLCSSVYSKSEAVGEGVKKIKGRRKSGNQQGEGKVDPEFVASPNGEIAGESIVDSEI
ncbi:hypothetical protein SLA2020_238070 [Shorea laevis]